MAAPNKQVKLVRYALLDNQKPCSARFLVDTYLSRYVGCSGNSMFLINVGEC